MDNEKRIIIIDGNSLINRAFYAMRRPMMTKDGIYTQGIFAFLNMLEKVKKDHPSGYVAVAFDLKAPTFRHKQYEEYKAGRKKMPPELAMEMPILKDILKAMNIKMLELEGYEADDLIGTMARKAEEEGLFPLIISGDRDLFQLATQKTNVFFPKKGVSDFQLYDYDKFVEEYGFTPTQFIDYKGLMGDSSDNIPGLPGVGPKRASELLMTYGSVEGVLEHVDELKGKLKENVEENGRLAILSKELATICTEAPLEVSVEECKWQDPDIDALIELYKKLEFNKFLANLGSQTEGVSQEEVMEKDVMQGFEEVSVQVLATEADWEPLQSLEKQSKLTVKVFGNDDHKHACVIDGISFLIDNNYYYVDWSKEESKLAFKAFFAEKTPLCVGHDLHRDYYMLMDAGIDSFSTAFDTAVAQYVLDSGRSNYELSALIQEYFHVAMEKEEDFAKNHGQEDLFSNHTEDYAAYGKQWCYLIRKLSEVQAATIREEDLTTVMEDIEIPLVKVMASLEYEGFRLDKEVITSIGKDLAEKIDTLAAEIYELAGEEFNIKSPKQLGVVLFEHMQLPAGKKTKSGYSTSADVLEKLADEYPIVSKVLEYRQLTKLQGTYVEGLLTTVHNDGKIHAHFNQTVTTTGRISSSEPNLQNIPVRTQIGRNIRKAFIADNNAQLLMGADYSQIELRVLADMSGDEALQDSFNNGEDIHRATAARVLGIPEEEITPEQRSSAKAINFGVIYGISAFGLSEDLHITRKEADHYIQDYFTKHPKVKAFMDEQVAFCKEHGYVKTITGRKRHINEIHARNFMVRQFGERTAMNTPIQGSAADIIKLAMIRVYERLKAYESKLILQVHDELIIRVAPGEEEAIRSILTESMEGAMKMAVKLAVDLNTGNSWYELK